jgi:hypothetical protein
MKKQPTSGASKATGIVPMIETRSGCSAQIKTMSPKKNINTPAAKTPRPENNAVATQYSMTPLMCRLDRSGGIGEMSSLFATQVVLSKSTSGG